MDGMLVAMGSFIRSTLGSVVTGYLVELYRQKNRLQLAAVDKPFEPYQQDAYRRTLKLIDFVQEHKAYPERPLCEEEEFRALKDEAKEWLEGHYLYLGKEVGGKVAMAIGALEGGYSGEKYFQAARIAIEKAAGLPGRRF